MQLHICNMALVAGLACTSSMAADMAGMNAVRLEIGAVASSGLSDLKDKIEAADPNFKLNGAVPIGLSVGALGNVGSDWSIGGNLGPFALARGDVHFAIIPASVEARYKAGQVEGANAYLRFAAEKALTSGDCVTNSSIGAVLGIGVGIRQFRSGAWGLDVALHTTPVKAPATSTSNEQTGRPFLATVGIHFAA